MVVVFITVSPFTVNEVPVTSSSKVTFVAVNSILPSATTGA